MLTTTISGNQFLHKLSSQSVKSNIFLWGIQKPNTTLKKLSKDKHIKIRLFKLNKNDIFLLQTQVNYSTQCNKASADTA